jgi:hypothetical protein
VEVIPTARDFRYVKTRREIGKLTRPAKEIKELYGSVIHQIALRTIWECFAVPVAVDVVDTVVFNGIVPATNRATGQAEELHLISAPASRADFSELVLDQLDPAACLKHLRAILSPHPYDLEPIEPVIEFQKAKYRFADPVDARNNRLSIIEGGELKHLPIRSHVLPLFGCGFVSRRSQRLSAAGRRGGRCRWLASGSALRSRTPRSSCARWLWRPRRGGGRP